MLTTLAMTHSVFAVNARSVAKSNLNKFDFAMTQIRGHCEQTNPKDFLYLRHLAMTFLIFSAQAAGT